MFQLLRDMDEDIDTYLGLTKPEGSEWNGLMRKNLSTLGMFSIRQPFSMLMAARRRLAENEFEELLSATLVLSFRYNIICGQNPNEQERVYHEVAMKLAKQKITKLKGNRSGV